MDSTEAYDMFGCGRIDYLLSTLPCSNWLSGNDSYTYTISLKYKMLAIEMLADTKLYGATPASTRASLPNFKY